ncbi:MAG: nitronate monooxygenase, partial [Proteobacteria bacterium]|nr:nitronate monooxygenase [Pseudomonadota bacterium]
TSPLRKAGAAAGSPDFLSLFSGQAVGLNREGGAGELIETLVEETRAAMARLAG